MKRSCKCDLHVPNSSKIFSIKSKKYAQAKLDSLIKMGVFTQKRNFVCEQCLDQRFCEQIGK